MKQIDEDTNLPPSISDSEPKTETTKPEKTETDDKTTSEPKADTEKANDIPSESIESKGEEKINEAITPAPDVAKEPTPSPPQDLAKLSLASKTRKADKLVKSADADVSADSITPPTKRFKSSNSPSKNKKEKPELKETEEEESDDVDDDDEEEEEEEEEEGEEEEEEEEDEGEIEEKVMMVTGPGEGAECEGAPELFFSEEICEDVMYFYGEGSGEDCCTGNPAVEAAAEAEKETTNPDNNSLENNSQPDDAEQNLIATKSISSVSVFSGTSKTINGADNCKNVDLSKNSEGAVSSEENSEEATKESNSQLDDSELKNTTSAPLPVTKRFLQNIPKPNPSTNSDSDSSVSKVKLWSVDSLCSKTSAPESLDPPATDNNSGHHTTHSQVLPNADSLISPNNETPNVNSIEKTPSAQSQALVNSDKLSNSESANNSDEGKDVAQITSDLPGSPHKQFFFGRPGCLKLSPDSAAANTSKPDAPEDLSSPQKKDTDHSTVSIDLATNDNDVAETNVKKACLEEVKSTANKSNEQSDVCNKKGESNIVVEKQDIANSKKESSSEKVEVNSKQSGKISKRDDKISKLDEKTLKLDEKRKKLGAKSSKQDEESSKKDEKSSEKLPNDTNSKKANVVEPSNTVSKEEAAVKAEVPKEAKVETVPPPIQPVAREESPSKGKLIQESPLKETKSESEKVQLPENLVSRKQSTKDESIVCNVSKTAKLDSTSKDEVSLSLLDVKPGKHKAIEDDVCESTNSTDSPKLESIETKVKKPKLSAENSVDEDHTVSKDLTKQISKTSPSVEKKSETPLESSPPSELRKKPMLGHKKTSIKDLAKAIDAISSRINSDKKTKEKTPTKKDPSLDDSGIQFKKIKVDGNAHFEKVVKVEDIEMHALTETTLKIDKKVKTKSKDGKKDANKIVTVVKKPLVISQKNNSESNDSDEHTPLQVRRNKRTESPKGKSEQTSISSKKSKTADTLSSRKRTAVNSKTITSSVDDKEPKKGKGTAGRKRGHEETESPSEEDYLETPRSKRLKMKPKKTNSKIR